MRSSCAALMAAAALLPVPHTAAAIDVDGQLDPGYGPAVVVQTTQTGLSTGQIGDSNYGDLEYANGSELDAAHAVIENGVLHLFLGGNLAQVLNQNQNGTIGHVLDIFVDSQPGGLNPLNGLGAGHPLNGLAFDAGFEADFWFELSGDYDHGPILWSAGRAAFTGGSGGPLTHLGSRYAGGPGTLSGGTNPFGILATIDNRNTAGVTFGCNAASGAGVTTGVEWAIPLAAIGSPEGCVRVTVIVRAGGSQSPVSNQVLAPLPPGTCPPGSASTVNFAGHAGDQFFTICPASTDVPQGAGARLALRIEGPNPSRGERIRLAFQLPEAGVAEVAMIDCAGRQVAGREIDAGGGAGTVELSPAGRLAPGLYWVRLTQGAASVVRRLCVLN